MEERKGGSSTRRLCAGLLAHVDSGKTTLTEAMLVGYREKGLAIP